MRTILLSAVASIALLASAPARANPVQTNVLGDPAQAQVYGTGSASAAHSSATGGASTATGGSATGGAATAAGGNATGGHGGSAKVTNVINGAASGAPSGYVGGYSGDVRSAPDISLPSFGGGGMDCPTVGFGAAGSALGGGGGFGPSWISSDCNKRKIAAIVQALYGNKVAQAFAEKNLDGVAEAVKAAAGAATAERPQYKYPAWCRTHDGIWLSNLSECQPAP